jgi:hypothetical protein
LVRVLEVDSVGAILATLGDFVVPIPDGASIPDSTALPASCVLAGAKGGATANLRLAAGEIVVDDLRRSPDCLEN